MFIVQSLQGMHGSLPRSPHSPQTQCPAFKCAIFLSGVRPTNVCLDSGANGNIRWLDETLDGVVINIPTAHIFDPQDAFILGGEKLIGLCAADTRVVSIHEQGHEVPKSREAVLGAVHAIRRVIDSALLL